MDMEMITQIFNTNGLFAVMSVSLIYYITKTNDARELRYTETINKLSDTIGYRIDNIESDIKEIKTVVIKGE